jgi:hypothetical protein
LFKAGFDGGVEHLVADHHANAADQGRLLLHRDLELAAETLFERLPTRLASAAASIGKAL